MLAGDVGLRLKELITEFAAKRDIDIKAIEVMPDHVHLFIEFDPRLVMHKIIKDLKGYTSHTLRAEFPSLQTRLPSLWTRSYFACSVGHISEDTIKQYINNQTRQGVEPWGNKAIKDHRSSLKQKSPSAEGC